MVIPDITQGVGLSIQLHNYTRVVKYIRIVEYTSIQLESYSDIDFYPENQSFIQIYTSIPIPGLDWNILLRFSKEKEGCVRTSVRARACVGVGGGVCVYDPKNPLIRCPSSRVPIIESLSFLTN